MVTEALWMLIVCHVASLLLRARKLLSRLSQAGFALAVDLGIHTGRLFVAIAADLAFTRERNERVRWILGSVESKLD